MDHELAKQPPNLQAKLFPHQLKSIYNMEQLESTNLVTKPGYFKETKMGIQADATGYGKSLSMIGLILRDRMEWDLDVPFTIDNLIVESKGKIKKHIIHRFEKINISLIMASQSIIHQWENELKKTNLRFTSIISNKCIDDLIISDFDVIIVSPSFYNKIVTIYSKLAWKRFIFDEPGHLRITGMREIIAGFYWFVTATPHTIILQHRNCKGFMRDLFGRLDGYDEEQVSDFIDDITIANDIEFIKSSFFMPTTNHHYWQCYLPLYNVIESFVNSKIKTMIAAGNINGAILALGGEETSNIVELIKHKKLLEIRDIQMKLRQIDNDEVINRFEIRIHNIQEQIKDLDDKFKNMLNETCSICYEKLKHPVLEPTCHNVFCGDCILEWLERKNSCPCCRTEINNKLIYIKTEEESKEDDSMDIDTDEIRTKKMTKLEKIIDIILSNPIGKFIIFSDYDSTFFPIFQVLTEHSIPFVQLCGSVKKREKSIASFKDNINVMFLNSTNNCAGINLENTTDVILYHEMSSATENQIIGRANRIGRTSELNVHHLIY